jgi:hypothetical protein
MIKKAALKCRNYLEPAAPAVIFFSPGKIFLPVTVEKPETLLVFRPGENPPQFRRDLLSNLQSYLSR